MKTQEQIIFELFLDELPWLKNNPDYQKGGYVFNLPGAAIYHIIFEIQEHYKEKMFTREITGIQNFVNKYYKDTPIKNVEKNYLNFIITDSIIEHLMVDDVWKKIFHFKGDALKKANDYLLQDVRFNMTLFTDEIKNNR